MLYTLRTILRSYVHITPLILLGAAIALSPALTIGSIASESGISRPFEVRIEDLLLAVFLIYDLIKFLKKRPSAISLPPFIIPIAAWLCIGFTVTLINITVGQVPFSRSLLFFFKEVEYFIIFLYTFYHMRTLKHAQHVIYSWIVFAFVHLTWVIVQIITPFKSKGYYYGPTLFTEPQNPFGTGTVFLILSIFFLNLLLYHYLPLLPNRRKKIIVSILLIGPVIGIFASGSQTAGLSLLIAVIISGILYVIKTKNSRSFLRFAYLSLVIAGLFISMIMVFNLEAPKRQLRIVDKASFEFSLEDSHSRASIWKEKIDAVFANPYAIIVGLGKSRFGESHNQFVRVFAETGTLGLIAFLALIGSILMYSLSSFARAQKSLPVALSSGLFVTMFIMLFVSIPAESFIYAVKLSETFWFFAGVSAAVIQLNNNPMPR